jgi:hypothetical protein
MRNVLERVPADETDEWQGIDWREAGNQNPSGGIFQLRKQSTYSAIRGLRPVRSGMIKLVHVTKASFC